MDIYFILWIILHYYHYLFSCSKCLRFDHCVLFHVGSSVLLKCLDNFLHFLTSDTRYSRLTLFFSCPSAGINLFTKCSWFPMLSMVFKNQNLVLGVLIATTMPLLLGFHSRSSQEICIGMHILVTYLSTV